jgi:hypothetical protein
MKEVTGDKYMYLTYYVHLVGIKRRNWLQECREMKASKYKHLLPTAGMAGHWVYCYIYQKGNVMALRNNLGSQYYQHGGCNNKENRLPGGSDDWHEGKVSILPY